MMKWRVEFDGEFEVELLAFDRDVQDSLFAAAKLLAEYGPQLGRPHVDTLKGSKYANMKELRFEASNGEWRAAFAFDPERKAVLLVAGDKAGTSQKRFYRQLIAKADRRFSTRLEALKTDRKGK
jgi:hypothetical protein